MDDTKFEDTTPTDGEGKVVEAVQDEDIPKSSDHVEGTPTGSQQPANFSATVQGLTDKALHFLSHASNETLGACLVGLGATTYLVLGRVGLVIMGVAGGVVLHATWEGIRNDNRDEETKRAERERRRETSVEVMKRVLAWRSNRSQDEQKSDEIKVYANQELDYSAFDPETATALNAFTDFVIKDYVHYWYTPQLPGEESFPKTCRRTFVAFVLSLSNHLQRKRPADAFLDFVTNASSIIIVFLNELAAATSASPNSSPAEAIATYLALKPHTSLAYLLDQESQNAKLKDAAEDILQAYLDSKAYNCPPVHVFLKEVLAQLVLGSTVTLCSRPEWINEWIVYGLEESETTKEVMNIVDAGVEGRHVEKESMQREQVVSKKEGNGAASGEHQRKMSRAEEAMDEAMLEAKRLTQLMREEDEKRAKEEHEKQQALMSSSEDVSDVSTTQGAHTPTSSQSDRSRQDEEAVSWSSQAPSVIESPVTSTDERPTTPNAAKPFTSFDQLVPSAQPTALSDRRSSSPQPSHSPVSLTLLNAKISIFDDSQPGDRSSIKAKPVVDYLIQIEPSSSAFPGWMIARRYSDFETLHEVLRRISVITGVVGFTEAHTELPRWKVHTKSSLRSELERYLNDAVRFPQLAESEGMKRFLEKDQGLSKSPGKAGFGWPSQDAFGKLGGDMMNVLTKAPKQVAGGGKAVLGGVAGGGKAVFDGVAGLVGTAAAGGNGAKRPGNPNRMSTASTHDVGASLSQNRSSMTASDGYAGSVGGSRQSQDSLRAPTKPGLDRHVSTPSVASVDVRSRPPSSQRASLEVSRSDAGAMTSSSTTASHIGLPSPVEEPAEEELKLPPPPDEMPEDYGTPSKHVARTSVEITSSSNADKRISASMEEADLRPPPTPPRPQAAQQPPPTPPRPKPTQQKPAAKPKEPITDQETSVAVELMFAVITELYTLSSAWNFRRTLLSAAKTFLLRPGNPQLGAIRDLLQSSLLDANLSDAGVAGHIYKMRENALPTEQEMEIWLRDYPEKNEQEKEELRLKARKLLVHKGMPAALQSVMGAAASGEALGKVFDCLQVEGVARGLVFGLMLQALRVITH